MSTAPPIDLTPLLTYDSAAVPHIHAVKLLQYLEQRAILLAERTAEPRLDSTSTELLRGHRQEVLAFKAQIEKVMKNAK